MNHFKGVNETERFNNDMLNELRQIRQLLERNAQALESANKEETRYDTTSGRQRATRGTRNAQ